MSQHDEGHDEGHDERFELVVPRRRDALGEWLDHVFTYHPPGDAQVAGHRAVRDAARVFAEVLRVHVPSSFERAASIDRLRESVAWANAGIACVDPEDPPPVGGV